MSGASSGSSGADSSSPDAASSSGGGASGSSSGAGAMDGGTGIDAGVVDAGADVDTSKKITVWLAGDSTMQPCSSPCPCGWGSQFQPYFNPNATVVDNGVGGRSIQTWLYESNVTTTMANGECVVSPMTYSTRWQAMLDPTTGMKPGDYLFVEFGINDTDATCPRHVGTALFQTLLGTMAQAAKDRGAQPIFLTSTNAIICTGSTCPPNRAFGPETKAAGMADNVPVIDLTQLTADFYTSLGLCPNDGNYMSTTTLLGRFFCDDHTHFEAYGASQVAGVVAKALRDQNIGLAAYLK
jgi:lysophospholipase L1-like esterase